MSNRRAEPPAGRKETRLTHNSSSSEPHRDPAHHLHGIRLRR